MYEVLHVLINFWDTLTPERFIRVFWYFLIFDFSRYILLDFVLLFMIYLKAINTSAKERERLARERLKRENPLVSVIVPGKNEGKHFFDLGRTLKRQTYRNLEIIVVDDGSDDNTERIGRKAQARGIIDLFLKNDVRGGKASAANLAMRYAKGKYIVHLDADSNLAYDAIEEMLVPFYLDNKVGAVGGDIRVANSSQTVASALQGIEYAKTISLSRRITSALGVLRIISGAFGAFRKDVIDRFHGWDVGPGLDGDITMKIRKMGFKVAFSGTALCYTNVPISFFKLVKQRVRWSRSLVRFRLRRHNDILRPDANFSGFNFIAVLDNILFNVVLNFFWWAYLYQIVAFNAPMVVPILITNYLLYVLSGTIQFILCIVLSPSEFSRRKLITLIPFLVVMPLYTGVLMRVVRTYAYFDEFLFRSSYKDPWNPWKVSKVVRDIDK